VQTVQSVRQLFDAITASGLRKRAYSVSVHKS